MTTLPYDFLGFVGQCRQDEANCFEAVCRVIKGERADYKRVVAVNDLYALREIGR